MIAVSITITTRKDPRKEKVPRVPVANREEVHRAVMGAPNPNLAAVLVRGEELHRQEKIMCPLAHCTRKENAHEVTNAIFGIRQIVGTLKEAIAPRATSAYLFIPQARTTTTGLTSPPPISQTHPTHSFLGIPLPLCTSVLAESAA